MARVILLACIFAIIDKINEPDYKLDNKDDPLLNSNGHSNVDEIINTIKSIVLDVKRVCNKASEKYGYLDHPRLKKSPITVYIMINENDLNTIDNRLKDLKYFNYGAIVLFSGENFPCINPDGKLLLDSPNRLMKKSAGAGNVFKALRRYELLNKDM